MFPYGDEGESAPAIAVSRQRPKASSSALQVLNLILKSKDFCACGKRERKEGMRFLSAKGNALRRALDALLVGPFSGLVEH